MDSIFCLIYFGVIHATLLSSTVRINAYIANYDNGNVTCIYNSPYNRFDPLQW